MVLRLASAALLATLSLSAFAQTSMDKTMIVVNGEAVQARQYFKRMEVLPRVGEMVDGRFVVSTPGFLTINRIVNEILLLQLARENGVEPSKADVDAEVAKILRENPDALEGLKKIGFTEDDLRHDVKLQLAEFRLQTMGINVTDQQVETYYRTNIKSYTVPDKYRLRIIAVDTEAKRKAAEADLVAGTAFAEVAKKHSMHVSKEDGGDLGEVPFDEISPSLQSFVKGKAPGATTDWMSGEGLFAKVYIESFTPGRVVPLDAGLRADIRRVMMIERGQDRNNLGKMMADIRKRARIEYQGTPFDEQLKAALGG
jgi:parvulin-like peptidyl-prolyl isomerase